MKNTKIKPYKYTLLDKLNKLPHKEYKIAKNKIPIALNIARSTFEAWMYTKVDESRMIPGEMLVMLASYFGCDVLDMFTIPPEKINYEIVREMGEKAKKSKYKTA